jgi:hypothetical protein
LSASSRVPALAPLKLVFGSSCAAAATCRCSGLSSRAKISSRLRPKTPGDGRDPPPGLQQSSPPTERSGAIAEAYDSGQIRVTGDPNIQKLIAQVIQRHEERGRTKKVH